MPGPVASGSPRPSPPGAGQAVFAGYIRPSQNQVDAACAALARSADRFDQLAVHAAELAQGADAAAARCKAIREALVAKHG